MMFPDLSQLSLNPDALSSRPFEFLNEGSKRPLLALMEIMVLEASDRAVREQWQASQLANLLRHAHSRSTIWRSRLPNLSKDSKNLHQLPALTRQELIRQVETEGSLIRPEDKIKTYRHRTSGSSGIPMYFHVTEIGQTYNLLRYSLHGLQRNISKYNHMNLWYDYSLPAPGFEIREKFQGRNMLYGNILAPIEMLKVFFSHPNPEAFLKTFSEHQIPVWISPPGFMEAILSRIDATDLYNAGLRYWMCTSGKIADEIRTQLTEAKIKSSSSYSSEEVGPIGFECKDIPNYYHVVSSNVIVHPSEENFEYEGKTCNKIFVTHLHSYASPMINYDIGDVGRVLNRCPCGYDGQTIADLAGRISGSLLHADGHRTGFFIQNKVMIKMGGIKQHRARQVSFTKVIVDIVVVGDSNAVRDQLQSYIESVAGPGIEVELRFCDEIDWGQSVKRPSFRCEIQ